MTVNLYYDGTIAWIGIIDDKHEAQVYDLTRAQLMNLATDATKILNEIDCEANRLAG